MGLFYHLQQLQQEFHCVLDELELNQVILLLREKDLTQVQKILWFEDWEVIEVVHPFLLDSLEPHLNELGAIDPQPPVQSHHNQPLTILVVSFDNTNQYLPIHPLIQPFLITLQSNLPYQFQLLLAQRPPYKIREYLSEDTFMSV